MSMNDVIDCGDLVPFYYQQFHGMDPGQGGGAGHVP